MKKLLFVIDTTNSMQSAVRALQSSLFQIIPLVRLTRAFSHIGLLAYNDWDETWPFPEKYWPLPKGHRRIPLRWSEYQPPESFEMLQTFARQLTVRGGGDHPEAANVAAAFIHHLSQSCESKSETIVFWFTDAGPHFEGYRPDKVEYVESFSTHLRSEYAFLDAIQWKRDWFHVSRQLAQDLVQVFVFLDISHVEAAFRQSAQGTNIILSELTNGLCIHQPFTNADVLSEVIVQSLLSLLGCSAQRYEVTTFQFQEPMSDDMKQTLTATGSQRYLALSRYRHAVKVTEQAHTKIQAVTQIDLNHLITLMQQDIEYRDLVLVTFRRFLTPEHVSLLLTNAFFGKLWRMICRFRGHAHFRTLTNQMSRLVEGLPEPLKTNLRQWLVAAYNQMDSIQHLLQTHRGVPTEDEDLVIVCDDTAKPLTDFKQLLQIGRKCTPGSLQRMAHLLSGLRQIPRALCSNPEQCVAWNLPDKIFFTVLPHTLVPGCLFSVRMALILALVAYHSGHKFLQDRAQRFLRAQPGQWWYKPTFASLAVMQLLQTVPQCLSEQDHHHIVALQTVRNWYINLSAPLSVKVPRVPDPQQWIHDWMVECDTCHQFRSFSLMNTVTQCLVCSCNLPVAAKDTTTQSQMVQCHYCHVNYALLQADRLRPKSRPVCFQCHSDRNPGSTTLCTTCLVYFQDPAKLLANRFHSQCRACFDQTRMYITETTTLADFSRENMEELSRCLQVQAPFASLLNAWTTHKHFNPLAHTILPAPQPIPSTEVVLFHRGQVIHNANQVLEQVCRWTLSGQIDKGLCGACYEEFPRRELMSCCGRRGCSAQTCLKCIRAFYRTTLPGHIVLPSRLLCPFCKAMPPSRFLLKHHAILYRLLSEFPRLFELSDQHWNAWCRCCNRILPAVAKTCAAEQPELTNFVCDPCQLLNQCTSVICKECPRCGVMIEKTMGCNHMECTNCGCHWCFQCSAAFSDPDDVYTHMRQEHGTIGLLDDPQYNPADDEQLEM